MMEIRYGYVNRTGQFVIKPIFEEAGPFSEGLACVKKGGRYGSIDKNGMFVIKPQFEDSFFFKEGLAAVQIGRYMGFIDKAGHCVIEPRFESANSFHEGLARVKMGGKYGFIDKMGRFVIVPQFDRAYDFSEGLSLVTYDNRYGGDPKCGYIDKWGKFVVEPKFKIISPTAYSFSEGLAAINSGLGYKPLPSDKYGYIDKNGKIVIEPKYKVVSDFHEGLAYAKLENNAGRGFIDKTGKFVFLLNEQYGFFGDFRENLALIETLIERRAKWGYIDKNGQLVIEPVFEYASNFAEGLSCVQKIEQGKYGYIDKTGQFVIEPIFKEASDFSEGLATVAIEKDILHTPTASNYQSNYENKTQTSNKTSSSKSSSGCYIATAVYGSYDCPEVWTLRRYRDSVLDNSWYGKLFIRCYYFVSPTLVKWFGKTRWFRNLLRKQLNKWVKKLNGQGFERTPYRDK